MREQYLIKFSKGENIKFIGHLDLMRSLQRTIKRSGIPAEYSRGFNPHINMSIAQPLPVGIYSTGEYMDLYLEKDISEAEIMKSLNDSALQGIEILKVSKIKRVENKKVFKSMAEISAAEYFISIEYNNACAVKKNMDGLMNMEHWYDLKKTKRGECREDIRKFVKCIEYAVKGDKLFIETVVSCGSKENLSPQLLIHFIQNNTENVNRERFVNIVRKEMYGKIKERLVPLYEYVKYVP